LSAFNRYLPTYFHSQYIQQLCITIIANIIIVIITILIKQLSVVVFSTADGRRSSKAPAAYCPILGRQSTRLEAVPRTILIKKVDPVEDPERPGGAIESVGSNGHAPGEQE
jgi:hypothetical protein